MSCAARQPSFRPARRLALAVVLALAVPATSAQAQVSVPEPPPNEIPLPSAVSEQYHEVDEVIAEAIEEPAPAPPPAVPAPPAPAPEPAVEVVEPTVPPVPDTGEPEQYHSESDVTQSQPSNVNVSVRILSPGDDGPVVQINGAGDVDVDVDVAPPRPRERPRDAAPGPVAAPPSDWDWEWTSACFGTAAAAAAAAAGPEGGWRWRWSCDAAEVPDAPLPEPLEAAGIVVPGAPVAEPPIDGVPNAGPAAPAAREGGGRDRRARRAVPAPARAAPAVLVASATRPPPAAGAPVVPSAAGAELAPAGRTPRATRARHPRERSGAADLDFPLGAGGGHAAGPASGLGTVMSLLLGSWLAVIASALALVVPRLRRRRWSGPTGRSPQPPRARLERPG